MVWGRMMLAILVGTMGCGGEGPSQESSKEIFSEWEAFCQSTDTNIAKTVDAILQHLNYERKVCAQVPVGTVTKLKLFLVMEKYPLGTLQPISVFTKLEELFVSYLLSGPALDQPDSFSGIDKLKNLKKLQLKSVGLSVLPAEIQSLKTLEELDLSRNKKLAQPDALIGIDKLAALKTLDLSMIDLKTFPSEVFGPVTQLPLERLDLSGNALDPKSLGSLNRLLKLKELNVSYNNLSWLPSEMVQNLSQSLVVLDLSHNPLTPEAFNSVISWLTQLEELRLDSCGLTSLPPGMKRLTHLKKLNLSQNPNLQWVIPEELTSLRIVLADKTANITLPPNPKKKIFLVRDPLELEAVHQTLEREKESQQ